MAIALLIVALWLACLAVVAVMVARSQPDPADAALAEWQAERSMNDMNGLALVQRLAAEWEEQRQYWTRDVA